MLGTIEGRRRGRQRMRWLDGISDSMLEFEWTPGVGDAIQPSHPLSSSSPALDLAQHQGLFQ